jgi:hypothetical protein
MKSQGTRSEKGQQLSPNPVKVLDASSAAGLARLKDEDEPMEKSGFSANSQFPQAAEEDQKKFLPDDAEQAFEEDQVE